MGFRLLALIFDQPPHELIKSVIHWVGAYPGLFMLLMLGIAGIPLPDELLLFFFGVLAGHPPEFSWINTSYPWTLLVAWAGSSCGITLSYVIGRTAGLGVVHKWGKYLHVTPEKLQRVHEWYAHKKGRWALMFCIFAPVWRHLTAIVAGTSKMPFWEFMLCAYTGTLLWVTTFISVGYWGYKIFGEKVRHIAKDNPVFSNMHSILLGLSLLAGVGMVAYFIWKNRRDARRAAEASALAGQCGDAGDAITPPEEVDNSGQADK